MNEANQIEPNPSPQAGAPRLAASFRDPSGFLFRRSGRLLRQVNLAYQADYDRLMTSGLYARLVKKKLLVAHQEVDEAPAQPVLAYRVIEPELVPFISYPYEWSFSQLKDAALLTLAVQKEALKAGMSLKDASAYNVQFVHGAPRLIDTLSFACYTEGEPWQAYRQFCQHFLAPLALMSLNDVRLGKLLQVHLDGIPLDLASRLLPWRTRLNFGLLSHIHAHAAAQQRYAGQDVRSGPRKAQISKQAMLGLIDSLESSVKKLAWKPGGTAWADYYRETNYSDQAFDEKKRLVSEMLLRLAPRTVWDLGANTGVFSRLAAELPGCLVISSDFDPAAVEIDYLENRRLKAGALLPLVLDLTNPSPAIGWGNCEREAFIERGPADVVVALALVHHLAIANNVPLPEIARLLARLGRSLLIEFVPKGDSQVEKLLAARQDIFPDYTEEGFLKAFGAEFDLLERRPIQGSDRTLFLFTRPAAGE
ncbi:MAG: class I SAM-dependent methyltransferase [Chloroflexota bacterium]